MTGLQMSTMNVGPLSVDANIVVAFSPGHLEIPTTAAVIVHPTHGVVLWDTGISDVVADPDRRDAYWGAGVVAAFGRTRSSVSTPSTPSWGSSRWCMDRPQVVGLSASSRAMPSELLRSKTWTDGKVGGRTVR
jgi:hypothetical protein